MSSRLFLDSSILVEKLKGRRTELYDYFIESNDFDLHISQIVISEFTYYWIAIGGTKSPVTLKRDGSIGSVLLTYDPGPVLTKLIWTEADSAIIPLYLRFMQ